MDIILFKGMEKDVSNEESTRAANEFGECLDRGKNPDECVDELKYRYEWISDINFSDLILLYKNW